MQFFTWDCLHPAKSWWQHFEDTLPELAELGVTQVWLPPVHKGASQKGRGYDAYDLWDLGEFDQKGGVATRWGTRDELLRACQAAERYGIDIIIDAVLNHKMGGDRVEKAHAVVVDPKNRLKDLSGPKEIQAWSAFDFPGRKKKYSSLCWDQRHFTGIDWDHKTKTRGIYRFVGGTHEGWSKRVDKELGNYDYLLGVDIDHRHEDVQQDQLAWGRWILETTGGAGFRIDAIKHFDRDFLLKFITTTKQRLGRDRMFAVAEYWSANLKLILPYIRALRGQTALFDVPLHYNFHNASKQGHTYDLRRILDNTIVKIRPRDAVTFVDNHEYGIVHFPSSRKNSTSQHRAHHAIHPAQPTWVHSPLPQVVGQSLESWVGSNFKTHAYALILLRGQGHPCVFYGDLYPNDEGYNERTAADVRTLMDVRQKFAHGDTKDYLIARDCIGFTRVATADCPGCAVVLSNGVRTHRSDFHPYAVRMYVGKVPAQTNYRSCFEPIEEVSVGPEGWHAFKSGARGVQVWVPL